MARANWAWIRLLLSDLSVTYEEVINMDIDEVYMLNAALDIQQENIKKQTKNAQKKQL